ncbi:SDR family oxidoreductase [Allosaccharopolyspora coralli]|uniref:SDR family oxidoreductase n=1 Tax=Allosaccharopolyspora coralli TaxID=2665642 RepID=UPI001C9E1EC5|nr:SDR family oxidoreductase [Allosaccharopolyspora coralli]
MAVTGGAHGIGREIARQLAAAGARVAIGDRDLDAALTTAEELTGERHDDVAAFELDVTDTTAFSAFLAAVEHRWGPIDVLVNNAGVMWVGPFEAESDTAAQRQVDVNLHGVIRGVKLMAPAMRERGHGQIITMASGASKLAPAGEATYAATKHAVYGYLNAVRTELHGSGVRLSVIMPAVVETELAVGTATGPVRRLVAADVAKAVLDVVRRPRFEVTVPYRVGLVARLAAVLPDPARFRLLRAVVPNQVTGVTDRAIRATYENRSLTDPSPTVEQRGAPE